MAITLTDQVQFTDITAPAKNMGAVISKSGYKDNSGNNIDDEYEGSIQTPSSFVNAIDINRNGAELDQNTAINTTGQLLSIIKDLKERLDAAELLIRGIYAGMSM